MNFDNPKLYIFLYKNTLLFLLPFYMWHDSGTDLQTKYNCALLHREDITVRLSIFFIEHRKQRGKPHLTILP